MLSAVVIGIAAILFMLGVISLQIATLKPNSWLASILVMLVFLACCVLAGLIAMAGLTGIATSL